MATIVCQGLQCLESQLVEARTLRLKLSSPKPHFTQPLELALKSCFLDHNTKELEEKCHYEEKISNKANFLHDNKHISSNPDLGGWSFLQALSPSSQTPQEAMETTKPYVHPLVKRTLSEKSLELCTENLGSETGTDITEDDSIFSLSSSDSKGGNYPTREQQKKSRQPWGARKVNSHNYPPPLTTISGSESLQVRSHREDGRLIVKAVKAPSTNTTFQAERSHGRLRLYFLKDSTSDFDSKEVTNEENEASNEDKKEKELEEEEEEDENFQEQEDEEENDAYFGEEMDGNSLDVGAEMGMENIQRLTRCKEGECENKSLLNWEPLWVATS